MKTKLVLLDFDGIIVDSFHLVPRIYSIIEDELKVPESVRASHMIKSGDFFDVDYRKALAKLGIVEPDRIKKAEAVWEHYAEELHDQIELIPGIKDVIEKLHEKYDLAIMSNNNIGRIETDLKKFGLRNYFSHIVALKAHEGKPKPDGIIRCMKLCNANPDETVYIGDMQGDIIAGKRAGLKKTIAATFGFHSRELMKQVHPDIIIDRAEQILDVIE